MSTNTQYNTISVFSPAPLPALLQNFRENAPPQVPHTEVPLYRQLTELGIFQNPLNREHRLKLNTVSFGKDWQADKLALSTKACLIERCFSVPPIWRRESAAMLHS